MALSQAVHRHHLGHLGPFDGHLVKGDPLPEVLEGLRDDVDGSDNLRLPRAAEFWLCLLEILEALKTFRR